jgi:uncharacterized protein (DUF427 family)
MDRQFYEEVTRRAYDDPDFRERLLEDPKSIVAEVAGIQMADDAEVVVLENNPKRIHIVLPPSDVSITELDEMAAGRQDLPSWWVCWGM